MAGAADTPPPTGPMGATGAAPGAIYKPFDALSNASILNGTKGHPFFLASLWDLFDARKLATSSASGPATATGSDECASYASARMHCQLTTVAVTHWQSHWHY